MEHRMAIPSQKKSEALARAREAAGLGQQGLYRCWFCKRVRPLQEGLVTTWGGSVLFAACLDCFPKYPLVMRQTLTTDGKPGIYAGPLRESDRPSDIVVVSNLAQAATFIPDEALSRPEKVSMQDE